MRGKDILISFTQLITSSREVFAKEVAVQECFRMLTWIGLPVFLISCVTIIYIRNNIALNYWFGIISYGIGVFSGICDYYIREELLMIYNGRSAVLWIEKINLWLCTAYMTISLMLILKQMKLSHYNPLSNITLSLPIPICAIIWFLDSSQLNDIFMGYYVLVILIEIILIIKLTILDDMTSYDWITLPFWISLLFTPFYQYPGWWFYFEPISVLFELIWMRHALLLLLVLFPILICFLILLNQNKDIDINNNKSRE